MNTTNVDGFLVRRSAVELDTGHTPHYQSKSVAGKYADYGREAVALFPAGRFFRFPVRLKIRIVEKSNTKEPLPRLSREHPDLVPEPLHMEVERIAWALIENGNCIDDTSPMPEIFLFGDVVADFRKMELRRGGIRVEASALDFKTLLYFLTHPEMTISRDELLNRVWGFHHYPTTRTVDNRILQLRKKLEIDPANPTHFLTVHGVGYKFVP